MIKAPSIKPFQGWFYDHNKISTYADVVCPPYDVIDAKKKEHYYQSSPYNYCRILLKEDGCSYQDLAERFNSWVKEGVFQQDGQPAYYLYRQRYKTGGGKEERLGFIGLLRADDEKLIHPHEYTHQKAKDDRFNVLKEVRANLEPIFIIAPDPVKIIQRLYRRFHKNKPVLSLKDRDNVHHTVWKINKPADIAALTKEFQNKKLVIADGHHRFEVSREYFLEIGKKQGISDSNYLMAYFTDCSALTVLPTHRVIRLPYSRQRLVELLSAQGKVAQYNNHRELSQALQKIPHGSMALGIYQDSHYLLFTSAKSMLLKKIQEIPSSKIFAHLDVFLLHKIIFDIILRIPAGTEITYTHSDSEAIEMAREQNGYAFLVRPTTLKEIIQLARKGIRMPQKSTYFYPKVLSGMVLRRFQ